MILVGALLFGLNGCIWAEDRLITHELAAGGYEVALPYSMRNIAMDVYGNPMSPEKAVAERAKLLCPGGYKLGKPDLRKRAEYLEAEKIWIVTCK
jgi:hypothetical protein